MLIHILDNKFKKYFLYHNSKTHVQMLIRTLNNYFIIMETLKSQVITAT